MKILLISSSPRKEGSLTFLLAQEVLRGCATNHDVISEVIQLHGLKIEFCRHCDCCHKDMGNCAIKDDISLVIRKMLEADGIILASPNYINMITAAMKALFDRCTHFIHCKRLLGKYMAGVVTSGNGEDAPILAYIGEFANICGAQYSGGVSARIPVSKEKMDEAYALGERLALDIKERRAYPDQIRNIEKYKEQFKKVIQKRSNEWEGEYDYWVEKSWI